MFNKSYFSANSKNVCVPRKRKRLPAEELRKQQRAVRKFIEYFYKTSSPITNSDFAEIATLLTQSDKRHFKHLLTNEISNHKKVVIPTFPRIFSIPNRKVSSKFNSMTYHQAVQAFCAYADAIINSFENNKGE